MDKRIPLFEMNKLRVYIIIADVVLIVGMTLAILVQSAGNLFALAFLPWLAWPYLIAIQVWWSSKTRVGHMCLALFIALCAVIQASVYLKVFIWHVDAQSTFNWFLSPLYCVVATVLLIPYVLDRRKNTKLSAALATTPSAVSHHG
jgi:heme/copper-type cytochrome/quinol oxidase subunit 4